ncbi:SPC97/SPC98 domain-containing protein [Rhizoctonia solani]|uniref:Spindle pole body component n=1 Tax=Rhizoctonia solani TaxID=456999 RepID=A0A8H8SXF4_9AGAM|nr:SPC97/SPC98 domain-containing protein [Rhizoctonia solani]QRW21459.1 SPC97/SPC98 domain-containing protein [Rhizoctonia solani]
MFSIDSNALNQTRFVVHPLKPINLSTPFDSTESQSPGETTRISDSDSDSNQSGDVQLEDDEPDVWTVKASEGIAKNSTFSWDAPVKGLPTRSAFLSEQSAKVFVAARFHVQPRLISDGDAVRRFISPADLLSSLRTTLLGGTSQLFSWDERDAQHTVRVENNEFGQTILVLGELSEETTSSLIAPLLEIGTLIRRIENTVLELRRPSTAAASRALAYSLQSIISLIQSELTTRLPETLTMASLSRLSTSFNDLRFELTTLAELCHCPLNESPPFAELPSTQTSLLDHLFLALDHAISHSAPYRTSAMIAYLLVTSSQDFNDSLAVTIGLVLRSSRPAKSLVSGHKIDLPSFFSERSKLVLGSAARALDILRRADPEHPLCRTDWAWKGPGWGWFDKDLHAVDALTQKHILNVRKTLNGLYGAAYAITSPVESEDNENETHSITSKDGISPSSEPTETTTSVPSPSEPVRVYKPEIATFSVFDQPPGSHIPAPIKDISVAQFISNGPRVLPLSAPTLPLLLDVSLLALPLAHSRLISSALFRVFTGRLAFKAHLKVLRGFLLGDDAKFWSRLRGLYLKRRVYLMSALQDNMADERAEREGRSREWGVGLAVGLSDREGAGTWPPGGAELGLRLRHVIDDTLGVGWGIASTSDSDDEESETARERGPERIVLKETPWRLGFILRDLEEESPEGRARWLNPNAIEALDFLCLDYKPPDPIDAIITLDIRHKMHRIFTFLLRLLRVETVTRILFNTIFQEEGLDSPPVLLMARFKIQSFISSLIGYVKDMAIGFHWDSFLAKLDEIEREDESKSESTLPRDLKKERMASDIFAVHSHLSNTMDQILESCLLRARQRAVGNALKECMEAVLVLGKLVGDRCRQHSSSFQDETYEKQFVLNVAKVLRRFDRLHNALIAALRALDLKGVSIAAGAGPLSTDDIQLLRRQEGESEGIYGRMATWLDPAARCTKPKTITA